MFWRKSLQFGGATDPKLKNVDRGGTDVPINLGISAKNRAPKYPGSVVNGAEA
jgi:hypothetical protein